MIEMIKFQSKVNWTVSLTFYCCDLQGPTGKKQGKVENDDIEQCHHFVFSEPTILGVAVQYFRERCGLGELWSWSGLEGTRYDEAQHVQM